MDSQSRQLFELLNGKDVFEFLEECAQGLDIPVDEFLLSCVLGDF
jgi:hypothetical protein